MISFDFFIKFLQDDIPKNDRFTLVLNLFECQKRKLVIIDKFVERVKQDLFAEKATAIHVKIVKSS